METWENALVCPFHARAGKSAGDELEHCVTDCIGFAGESCVCVPTIRTAHEADQQCVAFAGRSTSGGSGGGYWERRAVRRSTLQGSNTFYRSPAPAAAGPATCALYPSSLVLAHCKQTNRGCKAQSLKALNERMLRNRVELIMTRSLPKGRPSNR